MISVNTNLSAMYSQNYTRLNLREYNEKVERLSSGLRINRGADDPSGIAISGGMKAQIHGVNTAIGNAQDTICLLQLTDDFLNIQSDIMLRMRDMCVRLGNIATLGYEQGAAAGDYQYSDCVGLHREIEVLKDEIFISFAQYNPSNGDPFTTGRLNYDGKDIFSGAGLSGFATGLPAQIGPDNGTAYQMQIVIDDLADYFSVFASPYKNPPDATNSISWYQSYANKMTDILDDYLGKVNGERVRIGTQINTIKCCIDDLEAEYINVSASNSQIEDADMADEMTAYTKNLIKQQTSGVAASQATAEPLITTQLVQAIYDGLNERMAFNAHVGPTPA